MENSIFIKIEFSKFIIFIKYQVCQTRFLLTIELKIEFGKFGIC